MDQETKNFLQQTLGALRGLADVQGRHHRAIEGIIRCFGEMLRGGAREQGDAPPSKAALERAAAEIAELERMFQKDGEQPEREG